MGRSANTIAEFLSLVDRRDDSCWIWRGGTNGLGYGQFRMNWRVWASHRLMWTLAYGFEPIGLDVLHHCDNPPCVNPEHLFLGTDQDNSLDMHKKGQNNKN